MPAPATVDEFLDLIRKSGVVEEGRLNTYYKQLQASPPLPTDMSKFAGLFVRDGLLTFFQAEQFLLGKWKRFTIGKYKVLERIGSGGMGQVFLCEHKLMRRKVAVKVLPTAKAEDPSSLERFYREARAVAALDHPNIVRAYDIDQDDNLHFLVMEYVDGASLQEMVKKHGPMDFNRACHYIYWSAVGLQHAHEAGLIHRDIKPGNILVDRQGVVKILDMGLARFFNDDEDMLTKKYDENVLGTADYLAPEQALDSHNVDGRADIYSLGATFYFMLTAHQPFVDGTVAQKLIWHQTRNPRPIRDLRTDVPDGVVTIVEKMMAKNPDHRYQSPAELAQALTPFVQTPIEPPPEKEMPTLSAAAQAVGGGPTATTTPRQPMPVQKPSSGSATQTSFGAGSGSGSGKPGSSPPIVGKDSDRNRTRKSGPVPVLDSEQTKRRSGPAPIVETMSTSSDPAVWESLAADTNDAARDKTDRQPSPIPQKKPRKVEPESLPDTDLDPLPSSRPQKKRSFVMPLSIAILTILAGGLKYSTVKDALDKVKEGQQIVILDALWEEELTTPSRDYRGVTITGSENTVWKLPEGKLAKKIMLLQNAEGITIRNLKFEGNLKTENGIMIVGKSAGIVIEDVMIKDMNTAGIQFTDCGGAENSPLTVQRSRIIGSKGPAFSDAGMLFLATPENKSIFNRNESIVVKDNRIEGIFKSGAITIDGSIAKVDIRNNRIWQGPGAGQSNGLFFKDAKPANSYRLFVKNNTFHSMGGAGIRFKNAAVFAQKTQNLALELELNYFVNNALIVKSDDNNTAFQFRPIPADNARNNATKEGAVSINATPIDGVMGVNPDDDKTFLRYLRNSPLNKVPPHGKPVGALPE
ncbi:MAG: protein kinase [Planctomycetes bacterium]|nr:protein kinase [Planctomycetota bacterium]